MTREDIKDLIQDAINKAVEYEREACAKVVEKHWRDCDSDMIDKIAEEIRNLK